MLKKENPQLFYKVKSEGDVYVTRRDGVTLAVDIFRPDAEGKFPALLAISPYGKDIQSLEIPPKPAAGASLYELSAAIEAGDPQYIIYHDEEYPSHLLLPIIPQKGDKN